MSAVRPPNPTIIPQTSSSLVFDTEVTLEEFWDSNRFYQFIVGPLGSAKTTNCIMKLMMYASMQAKGQDGYRRTRFALVRPTLQQLKTTVLQDILTWLRPVIRYKVSDNKIEVRVGDVISDWYMLPLETVEDQRRLLSMQLSGVYINEFREVPLELMTAAAGRVDRYPRKSDGGCTHPFVMGDTNPPSIGSDWYEFLVLNPPHDPRTGEPMLTYVHQPSGMSPEAAAGWRKHLPSSYYERLAQGHDSVWVNTHVHSNWSPDLSGEAVWGNSYVPEFHERDELLVVPGDPVLIGADWGRTPAVLFGQLDPRGRLLVQHELTGENTSIEPFFASVVQPALLRWYAGHTHYLVGDPSGTSKSDKSEESVFDILQRLGFAAIPAPTNDIAPRLRAVESRFARAVGGEAGILVDRSQCPLLSRAIRHDYKYPRRKTGRVDEVPDKNHPWSDLADALQYLCLGVETNAVERAQRRESRRAARRTASSSGVPRITPAAWT